MNIIDIVIVVILIFAFVRGFMKGFFVEIASLIALIGGIYGGTSGMGWKNIIKPKHFTWKQYAEFLISTLPENSKKKIS